MRIFAYEFIVFSQLKMKTSKAICESPPIVHFIRLQFVSSLK